MGRHEKLVARFERIPVDFSWEELCRLLAGFGFNQVGGAGSRYKFVRAETNRVVCLHRPHPGNIVKKYALRQVLEVLKRDGFIE